MSPYHLGTYRREDLEHINLPVEKIDRYKEGHSVRTDNIKMFQQITTSDEYIKQIMQTSLILDLDLDYFYPIRYSQREIRESLKILKNIQKWDAISVAISPAYCGGNEQAEIFLGLFLDEFELNMDEAQEWSVLEFDTN